MAQPPLREHYATDEDYFRELDIFNTRMSGDVATLGTSSVTTGVDDEGRPTVDGSVLGYQERYLAVAYATSADGSMGFTNDYTSITGLTVYQGVRNQDSTTELTTPASYTWRQLTVISNWMPQYRIIGGRQIDWRFTPSAEAGYTVDTGEIIDLDSLPGGVGARGPAGEDGLVVWISTDNGTVFRNNAGPDKTLTANVNIGGNVPTATDYAGYDYNWLYEGNTVYVDSGRNLLTVNGIPITTPAAGRFAANSETTTTVGDLRSIFVQNNDVNNQLRLAVEVSNIPDRS